MFNISAEKLLLIAGVAFAVLGPERIPRVARALAHLRGEIRKLTDSVPADTLRVVRDPRRALLEHVAEPRRALLDAVAEPRQAMRDALAAPARAMTDVVAEPRLALADTIAGFQFTPPAAPSVPTIGPAPSPLSPTPRVSGASPDPGLTPDDLAWN